MFEKVLVNTKKSKRMHITRFRFFGENWVVGEKLKQKSVLF